MWLTTKDGRKFWLHSEEEDRKITEAALADPDAQPLTDEQLAQMVPIQHMPELLKKLRKERA
ncbi:hypothetical protein [Massilia sp. YIM B04103]|uniref:hypothetical protein n=1 Tax=Massilia sp. YIM B04103 TaxID=2963106 RepID=UPI00210DAF80|nr:hypothetical protein [Massilia sp. YIM B04103]